MTDIKRTHSQTRTQPTHKHKSSHISLSKFFFSIIATKIPYTNIDNIIKIKMIKNIQTSTNTWQQKLLPSLTYLGNNKRLKNIKNIV